MQPAAADADLLLSEDPQQLESQVGPLAPTDPSAFVELLKESLMPLNRRRRHSQIVGQFLAGSTVAILAICAASAAHASGRRATSPLLDKRTHLYVQVVEACVQAGPAAKSLLAQGADPTTTAAALLSARASCTRARGLLKKIPSGDFAAGARLGGSAVNQTRSALTSYLAYLDTSAPTKQALGDGAIAAARYAKNRMLRSINAVRRHAGLSAVA